MIKFNNRDSYNYTFYTDAWLANHYQEKYNIYPFFHALKGVKLEPEKVFEYLLNKCGFVQFVKFSKHYEHRKYIEKYDVYFNEKDAIYLSINTDTQWTDEKTIEVCGLLFFYPADKQALIDEMAETLLAYQIPPKSSNISIITRDSRDLTTESYTIKNLDLDIDMNYNDDFKDIDKLIRKKLIEEDKGIVLLHGNPGTGKTSYVRHLATKMEKKIIFIPPYMSSELSSPEFLNFMLSYGKNSILLIEDGEEVIKARKSGGGSAVNNLLNISDGILGDILNCQIIVTFNCDLKDVDEALCRKGRIIAIYEFTKLKKEKALKLAKHLNKSTEKINGDTLLTDIYNVDEVSFNTDKRKIGF